jgi:hypothetical protein
MKYKIHYLKPGAIESKCGRHCRELFEKANWSAAGSSVTCKFCRPHVEAEKYLEGTKGHYVALHGDKLSVALRATDWPDDTPIRIINGWESDRKNSNLAKALRESNLKQYVVGRRCRRRTEGFWMAVA